MVAQTQRSDAPPAGGSVDPDEVAQFSRLAAQWWDPTGKFKPLHEINPLRIGYIKDHMCRHFIRDKAALRPFEGLTLVDIGCGGGLICEPMARLGAAVTGIDASQKNIGVAKTHAEQSGLAIDYRVETAEGLAATFAESGPREGPRPGENAPAGHDDNGFDTVLALEIIEHVTDPQAFITSCAALVKPGGLLVMTTINRTVKSLLMAKIGAEYVLRLLPRGTHQWQKFVRPSEMVDGVHANGMELVELRGMVLNPMKWQWYLSETDLDVNYLMVACKPVDS